MVCASFTADGWSWLSLGRAHPQQGFVELSGAPPFDESWRGRPELVRRYRALLADQASAFLRLEDLPPGVGVQSSAATTAGADTISQRLVLERPRSAAVEAAESVRLRFSGRLRRPALAMITEVSPPEPDPPEPEGQTARRVQLDGPRLRLPAPELSAEAIVEVRVGDLSGSRGDPAWQMDAEGASLRVLWPAGQQLELVVSCTLAAVGAQRIEPNPGRSEGSSVPRPELTAPPELPVPSDLWPAVERIHARALDYVRGCTALRVGRDRVAILTDHRLLPLSWARDAYYQAHLLLRAGETALVADHLRWLWLDCRRPAGWWARSHHANGRRKDEVYQADQQLYPLLELADYRRATGGLPELDDGHAESTWGELLGEVVEGLLERLRGEGLLATAENAADDPAGLPFLLANQVLAWHALERLADLAVELPELGELAALTERLHGGTVERFVHAGPDGPLWAYAIDGRGRSVLYQDANDVPTALAPAWGFCPPDDPLWRATVDFCFGPRNPAYAAGPYGGLGSAHTPGVWPLGLIQEWIARGLAGQAAAAEDALRRLVACALSDGSLPEASDPQTGQLAARPWFAWPGALLALLLPDRRPG